MRNEQEEDNPLYIQGKEKAKRNEPSPSRNMTRARSPAEGAKFEIKGRFGKNQLSHPRKTTRGDTTDGGQEIRSPLDSSARG